VLAIRGSLRSLILGLALLTAPPASAEPPAVAPATSPPAVAPAAPPPAVIPAAPPPAVAPAAPPPAVVATPAVEAEVAEHVAQARRLYLLGHYQEAIGEYRRAYELRADPQFLLDTAEAYRQLGATEQALFYYDRYLAAAPNAPDREIVEDRVTELELLRTPALPAAPGGAGAARPKPAPVWKRWWLWTAVGVALGAGITAAALSGQSTSPAIPATDLGNKKFY